MTTYVPPLTIPSLRIEKRVRIWSNAIIFKGEENLRIILIGQQQFASDTLTALIDAGEEIVGVISDPEKNSKRKNPLIETAQKKDLYLLEPESLSNSIVHEWVKELSPDLLILAFVTNFVPQALINLATYGGINYHPSLLPKYRGASAINWAVISGEEETGVTIHYIDDGLDTGDIILQEKVNIDFLDTVASLYFDKLYPLGIQLINRAVELIKTNRAPRITQDEKMASFQPIITEEDVLIDWNKNTKEIYNLIRGSDPTPGATSYLGKEKVKLWKCQPFFDPVHKDCGLVYKVHQDKGFYIATIDGSLLITRVQFPNTKKISATEAIGNNLIKVGDTFV